MGKKRKQRRQSHGSAWHWKQTDCWYYTMPGTRKRVPLFDEQGERIRGVKNKEAAEIALAKEKVAWSVEANAAPDPGGWLVARVCSDYIQYCQRAKHGKGPRGPRSQRQPHVWDLVTDVFHCADCKVGFYQTGAHG